MKDQVAAIPIEVREVKKCLEGKIQYIASGGRGFATKDSSGSPKEPAAEPEVSKRGGWSRQSTGDNVDGTQSKQKDPEAASLQAFASDEEAAIAKIQALQRGRMCRRNIRRLQATRVPVGFSEPDPEKMSLPSKDEQLSLTSIMSGHDTDLASKEECSRDFEEAMLMDFDPLMDPNVSADDVFNQLVSENAHPR